MILAAVSRFLMQNMPPRAPNRRLQLTAFGAQDRWHFNALLCCAPSAATEAQAVSRQPNNPRTILYIRFMLYFADRHAESLFAQFKPR